MTTTTCAIPARTLYGPAGWTRAIGAAALLLPGRPTTTPSFARFDGLDADKAAILLKRLPTDALTDRQNVAPTLERLLKACVDHPDEITLAGYLIGPTRHDERISVDMVAVRSPWLQSKAISPDSQGPVTTLPSFWRTLPGHLARADLWERTRDYLDLGEADAPDELEYFMPMTGTSGGWWMWWD